MSEDNDNSAPATFHDADDWATYCGQAGKPFDASSMYKMRLSSNTPNSLKAQPNTGRPVRKKRGELIMDNVWRFGSDKVVAPENHAPWGPPFPSNNFADRIHRFHWLRDLVANAELGERRARSLTVSWVRAFGKWDDFAWRIEVTSERVIHWLESADIVINPLNPDTRELVLECLGKQVKHLSLNTEATLSQEGRFRLGVALALAGACLPDGDEYLNSGLAVLEKECDTQILKDGGHISRSPQRLAEYLIDLNSVEDLLIRTGHDAPAFLVKVQARMQTMLKFLTLPDGGLLVAHGGSDGWDGLATTALAPYGSEGSRFSFAQQTGFHKVEAGRLRVYLDTGAPNSSKGTEISAASCLSLTVCDGEHRLITSIGAYSDLDPAWRFASRQTAASSVLELNEESSAVFARNDETGLMELTGPVGTSVRRLEEGDEYLLEGQHSGWREKYGLVYRRRLYVAKSGARITGEDALYRPLSEFNPPGETPVPYAVRFQLHPNVSVEPGDDNKTVLIQADGSDRIWRLRSELPLDMTRSIYMAGGGRRAAVQILIRGEADPAGDGAAPPNRVRWALSLREAKEK